MSVPPVTERTQRRVPWAWLCLVVGVGAVVRVVLAFLVQAYVDRKGLLCVFGDTAIYWQLAGSIVEGQPYRVDQMGLPHFALRTPGYPLFLALCRLAFGDSLMPARLVQAVLNAGGVALVFALAARTVGKPGGTWAVPIAAAFLAAIDPYAAGMSVLALSEGPFMPLMLLGLVGLATLWPREGEEGPAHRWAWAIGTGLAMGAAIQTRPSWALIVPALLLAWIVGTRRGGRAEAIRGAAVVALAVAAVMAPWWVRNGKVFGRFVPTALWVGASLYDGVSPTADGSSDMRFLEAPDIAALGEQEQDAELRRRSIDFARSNPARVFGLAAIKAARYWSPWPNADTLRSPMAAVASSAWTIPTFLLVALGAWDRRRDARALVLLLGPLLYFMALHMVFVSSIRYRIPGMLPAYALAALPLGRLAPGWGRGGRG